MKFNWLLLEINTWNQNNKARQNVSLSLPLRRWLRWSASKKSTSMRLTGSCARTWTWTGRTLLQREASSTACSDERQVLVLQQLSEGVGAKVLPLFLLYFLLFFPPLLWPCPNSACETMFCHMRIWGFLYALPWVWTRPVFFLSFGAEQFTSLLIVDCFFFTLQH